MILLVQLLIQNPSFNFSLIKNLSDILYFYLSDLTLSLFLFSDLYLHFYTSNLVFTN